MSRQRLVGRGGGAGGARGPCDYLIVGAGLFGAVCARELADRGKRILVLERQGCVGGACHTDLREGVLCQTHSAHVFHTDDRHVWEYVNRFGAWRQYRHHVKTTAGGRVYSLPVNLMTLQQVFGSHTARPRLRSRRVDTVRDWCLAEIGEELYDLLIEGYTRKQWGRDPAALPASIVKRLPVRRTWNDEYFDDAYQGLPAAGYTALIANMLAGVPLALGEDYLERPDRWEGRARRVIYTGPVDALFDYRLGRLDYRSLRFEWERLAVPDYQGCPTMNYADAEVPYTRVHEHKHFYPASVPHTLITREYPAAHDGASMPYYPVADARNRGLYARYRRLAARERPELVLGGRLGSFRYLDMDETIAAALRLVAAEPP
jgi:UDP-galactopyranose mutase